MADGSRAEARHLQARPLEARPLPTRSVLGPLMVAVFMRALPLTMFGPLLPGIARSLGAGLAEIGWIVATYATGSLVAQPVMGRFADVRGRRRIFLACIGLFGVGSLVCALSPNLSLLIAGRIIQALGAGGIQPVATSIVGERIPEEGRGSALGAIYAMFGLGTMAGALLGGAIVDGGMWLGAHSSLSTSLRGELSLFPWHLVFWVNVALAAIAYVMALRLPADGALPAEREGRFDGVGVLLIAGFTVFTMAAATSAAVYSLAFVAAAAACVIGLATWERHASAPLFDPLLFEHKPTAVIYAIAFLFGVPSFSLTIYSATYCIARFGSTAAQSGLALFGLAVLYVGGAIAGGKAVRRFGARLPLAVGLAMSGVALVLLATLGSEIGVAAAMALGGLGLGLSSAPPNTLILGLVARGSAGAATGLATMLATSGSITAPAAVSAFIHFSKGSAASAMQADFLVGAALCAACTALVGLLPREAEAAHREIAASN
jgi:MFS family permease